MGNPKVVYVYTCHNDFLPSRVLQNSKQTYKNFEIWISDGSDKDEYSRQIEKFAKHNNFNYFKVGPNGSKTKADNLNSFLKKSGVYFDYLLITDADEVLDGHMVEYSLKCFNSPKFRNLGYVSPLNYYYDGASLFTNTVLNQTSTLCWKTDFTKTFTLGNVGNLYSASCLISKKLLIENNNVFPNGCLEDYFLEHFALSSGFTSAIIPIAPCGQEFDKNIYSSHRRILRIIDWQIYLFKTNVFKTFNEKYSNWYGTLTLVFFSVPLIIISCILLPWIIWLIIVYAQQLFSNPLFITIICSLLFIGLISIISNTIGISKKTTLNKYGNVAFIFYIFYGMSMVGPLFKHWFNAAIRGKYSDFVTSSSGYTSNNANKKIWPVALTCICAGALLIVFVTLFSLYVGFANKWFLIGFLYCVIILTIVFFCALSFCIMHLSSNVIVDKNYNVNNFVYPREFYKFKEIKQQFLDYKKQKLSRKEVKHD